ASYRRDTTLSAALDADFLLDEAWALHATIDAGHVESSVATLGWRRAAATLGLSWSAGVF
ncbi:MAG TPA: hypothetical protein VE618_02190, partial [Myxococcaceae bacterium]|nr:hypothetical protein [Myxococcaceae bacterium]